MTRQDQAPTTRRKRRSAGQPIDLILEAATAEFEANRFADATRR